MTKTLLVSLWIATFVISLRPSVVQGFSKKGTTPTTYEDETLDPDIEDEDASTTTTMKYMQYDDDEDECPGKPYKHQPDWFCRYPIPMELGCKIRCLWWKSRRSRCNEYKQCRCGDA